MRRFRQRNQNRRCFHLKELENEEETAGDMVEALCVDKQLLKALPVKSS